MRPSGVLAFALSVLGVTAAAVGGQQTQPGCVTKCWANSQYVSNCAGDRKCLCDDADFQNAMYQCLYSQCQTAQFGVALHHALALCSGESSSATTSTVPAMLRQGGDLRKRGYNTQSNSVSYTRYSSRPVSSSTVKSVETITFTATDTVTPPASTYTTVVSSGSSLSTYTTVTSPEASTYTYTATFTTTLVSSIPTAGPSLSSQSTASSKTKTRGSQSVSASAYQTYATSRAYPKGSAVPYSVLTVKPSAVTVSNSVSAYSSSSASVVAYTSTVVISAVPVTSTATISVATSSVASSSESSSTGTSTLTKVITATATAYVTMISDGQVQAPTATSTASYLARRQAWDNQRYPADTQ